MVRDIFWLLTTAIGVYYCGRVWVEAIKDLQWIKASGKNGRLYQDGQFVLKQVTTYVVIQLIAFFAGVVRMFYASSNISNVRAWLSVLVVISTTVFLSFNARRELSRRHDLYEEINERHHGRVRTRRTDGE